MFPVCFLFYSSTCFIHFSLYRSFSSGFLGSAMKMGHCRPSSLSPLSFITSEILQDKTSLLPCGRAALLLINIALTLIFLALPYFLCIARFSLSSLNRSVMYSLYFGNFFLYYQRLLFISCILPMSISVRHISLIHDFHSFYFFVQFPIFCTTPWRCLLPRELMSFFFV